MSPFPLLMVAIAVEVGATAALPRAEGFTNLWWSLIVIGGYLAAIWLLTLVVQRMDVSVAYAIWAGLGTAAIAAIGYLWLGEALSMARLAGIGLIVLGVVLVNLEGTGHA